MATTGWEGLDFQGEWRRYQRLALEAFDADRAAARPSTYVVAPPGSGKTLLGLEMARRLGRPALVLCPTAALQSQWRAQLAQFGTGGGAAPLHCLTYQAICQTADPGGMLAAAARRRLAEERAAAVGGDAGEVLAEFAGYHGAAGLRLARDTARMTAVITREIARGEHLDLAARDLLSGAARRRLSVLRRAAVGTVILDECHHLLSLWGYLARTVVAGLGSGVHVIGLTATPPDEFTEDEARLYSGLLGEVDFHIPTPAVVKDGHLAPYQELTLFTTPLDSEMEWLRQHHVRFHELLNRLHGGATGPPSSSLGDGAGELSFPEWVVERISRRDTEKGARLPFAAFARRHPDLARAGLRYLHHTGAPPPADAPRGEGWKEAPGVEDWLVLLEDWALRCLRPHPDAAATEHWEQLAVGLADLGFTLERRGIRPGRSDIDRVLMTSAAKPLLVCDILAVEHQARGMDLRAVVLCDSEHPPRQPDDAPLLLAGGTRSMLAALGGDVRTNLLTPLMVTGTAVACLPADADAVRKLLAAELPALAGALEAVTDGGVTLIAPVGTGWDSADYVPAATRLLAAGAVHVLVGTRALLAEGWDCPPVNVVVDAGTVAASVAVRQVRGRSLRLDPARPEKVASNWDVVCVAPGLERGRADYQRFVRRHDHLHAPCEDGSIETGVSHVHPELSPFVPPDPGRFAALNAHALARAAAWEAARHRWRVGAAYRGVDLPALLVRRRERGGDATPGGAAPGPRPAPARTPPRSPGAWGWAAGALAVAGAGGLAVAGDVAAALCLPAAAAAATGGWRQASTRRRRCPPELELDRVAWAVLDAYAELGEIAGPAAASLAFAPRSGGYLRAVLDAGSAAENDRFSRSLAEALDAAGNHRYVISRPVAAAGGGDWRRLARAMLGRERLVTVWHPVPSDFGRHKTRAEAYARAWRRWVSPGAELCFTQGDDTGRRRLLEAIAAPVVWEANRRTLWV
jgi:superfamily II DNA or RNA helicase